MIIRQKPENNTFGQTKNLVYYTLYWNAKGCIYGRTGADYRIA